MFHRLFALDGDTDIVVNFEPNEAFQTVLLRKAGQYAFAMLVGTPLQIVRYAGVKHTVSPVRHDVYERSAHV
jgi:hypothetical protein